jgi:hypothetical protein
MPSPNLTNDDMFSRPHQLESEILRLKDLIAKASLLLIQAYEDLDTGRQDQRRMGLCTLDTIKGILDEA